MKNIFLFIAFFFIYAIIFSQKDPNIYDFFGGKSFGNKTVFFRLVFQIDHTNISGYMYTDEQGSGETKSIIKGQINPKTKRILFNETRKLLSKNNYGFDALCFMTGSIQLELNPSISKLKGTFFEQTAGKKKCLNGIIDLISLDAYIKLKKEIEKNNKEVVVKKPKELIKEQKVLIPTFNSDKKTTIKDDEEIVIYWVSDKINLSIWDDMKEDGDRITIKFNDEVVLDNFELKNKHKEIELELTEKENRLVFTANNTGYLANNTARVDLFDDHLKHQIITELQLNKSVIVIIKKQ
jgi:hypothetical protein